MKKTRINKGILALLILPCLLAASALQAGDLMQSYQHARDNDPQWAAARSKFLADLQIAKQGRAGLLPTLNVRARKARNKYESDADQIRLDAPLTLEQAFQRCAFEGNTVGCLFSAITGVSTSGTIDESYTSDEYEAELRQPLLKMDRWYDYKRAQAMTAKSSREYLLAEQELIIRVSQAYFDTLRAMGDLDTAEQEETAIRKQLGLVKKRYEQGLDPETSLYDAQSRYDLQKASLSVSASALQIAYRQLATVTGVYDTDIARISEELKILPPLPATGEEWVQLALAHNVSLEVARHSVDAAENEYKKQRAGHLPRLDLYAGYKESENDGGQGFAPASKASVIGVELTIPLYQGGMVSASRKRALYSHQEAKDRLTHQRWMVESNALNLHLTVVSDVQRFEAQERAIGSSRNAYRSTLKSYENGISMIRDVLSAQRVLFNAQRDLAHTRLDYIMNTLKLKQAAGTLTIEDLVALNKSMEYRDGG